MIGIIGAMHEEILELRKEMIDIKEDKIANMVFLSGKIHDKDVVLVESGIGKVNSAICATLLIERFKVFSVIFTGVAGGLAENINVGDVVISDELIQHDVDVTAFGSKPGEIPRMKEYIFKADKALIEKANKSANEVFDKNRVRIGRVLSGDQFVSSVSKIKELRELFSGDCVEMEGAAVAQVCYLFSVPFVVIRAISDKADHSAVVDFAKFVVEAANNSKKIVYKILDMI